MANILDYLNWRGDLAVTSDPFNEVDALILARLVYTPFDVMSPGPADNPFTIREAATALLALPDIEQDMLSPEDVDLLRALIDSDRFGDMMLSNYVNIIEKDTETQFAAMTVDIGDQLRFISFRGTDDTLVGWKENFNMSFTCPVPAQKSALHYLEHVAESGNGRLVAGGHSKGGNLAQYAAACCPEKTQERIACVYSFDGPGFDRKILARPGFARMRDRMFTYMPQSSIVGMLMEPAGKCIVVNSSGKRKYKQHDVYTWDLTRNHLSYLDSVTAESLLLDHTITEWLTEIELDRREKVIDAVYTAIAECELDSLKEFDEQRFRAVLNFLSSISNLDKETRKLITGSLTALARHWRENRKLKEEWLKEEKGDK